MSIDSTALIALGGNLGDVLESFRLALSRLSGAGIEVLQISSAFQTVPLTLEGEAWSLEAGPPAYWNAVCRIRSGLDPHGLLGLLHELEAQAGRIRRERWEARVLDLDLLGFGDVVIEDDVLTLPHPGVAERRFVLAPLVQVAPEWTHPILGVSAKTLLERLGGDDGEILKVDDHWAEGATAVIVGTND